MNVLKLFKLQIDEKYDIFKTKNAKKMLWSLTKYLFFLAVLTIVFYVLFLRLSLLGFATNAELVSVILLATQIITLLFAVGNLITTLYQSKDNELLMSLPASPNQIFVSKILVVYVQEVIINTLFTLPMLLAVAFIGGAANGFGWLFFLMMPFMMLILPLLPLGLASLISVPACYVLKFFKKHIALSVATLILVIAGIIGVYVWGISQITEGFNIASKQLETVRNINNAILAFGEFNIFYLLLAKGIMFVPQMFWPFVYLAISFAVFALAFLIIRPFFFKMAMGNLEHTSTKKSCGKFVKRTAFQSLLVKEFLTVFRSPGVVFQYFIFVLLMPFIVVIYDNLLLGMVVNQTGEAMIAGAHLLIVAVFAMLANIYSASSLSLEGSNFYIIKSSPIDYYTQTLAKVVFNAIFTVGSILLTSIITCFYLDIGLVILTMFIVLFASLGHIFLSFDLDLRHPTLDWYDNGEITKVNKNTTKSIIWGLVLALALGAFIMLTTGLGIWAFVILLVLSMLFCAYKAYILILRVFYQFEKLEV